MRKISYHKKVRRTKNFFSKNVQNFNNPKTLVLKKKLQKIFFSKFVKILTFFKSIKKIFFQKTPRI
ncbi:MAG: hypothetical protein B6I24_08060 [Bacteroidetes bacterium 4572_128]|nr:MAG: hypothetical protein B6I24_08060 [Bacteroidetes bacterium 4572_128]